MSIYYHPTHEKYRPKFEFSGFNNRVYPEQPNRIDNIISAFLVEGIPIKEAELCNMEMIKSIHSDDYIEFIRNIPEDIAEIAPTVFYRKGRSDPSSSNFFSKMGYYLFDPSTPLTSGVWEAAVGSVSTALACVDELQKGENLAVGLCRPPGHHASESLGGGYCFFNNIAIAAGQLDKDATILDLDYHHGNGTQEIFYTTDQVQYVSIHADTRSNYPFYWGRADERGEGRGDGYNINLPISSTSSESTYDDMLDTAIEHVKQYNPEYVLVSMGFDCYVDDPIAGMGLSSDYYRTIGEKLQDFSKLGIILEGGYNLDAIGKCFLNLYQGLTG